MYCRIQCKRKAEHLEKSNINMKSQTNSEYTKFISASPDIWSGKPTILCRTFGILSFFHLTLKCLANIKFFAGDMNYYPVWILVKFHKDGQLDWQPWLTFIFCTIQVVHVADNVHEKSSCAPPNQCKATMCTTKVYVCTELWRILHFK